MRRALTAAIPAIILLLACGYADGVRAEEIHKTFGGVKEIELSSVSGDCIVKTHKSDEVIVDLFYDVDPEGAFDYEMKESGSKLVLKERWKNSGRRSSSGRVTWTLTVPAATEIEFSTASGDIEVAGLSKGIEARTASGDIDARNMKGDIEISTASGDADLADLEGDVDISTASGDIDIENATGDIELSTASGDISADGLSGDIELNAASGDIGLSGAKGAFDVSCASGDIKADGITIEGESEFSVASGDVLIVLAKTSDFDLELNSASGDVTLDFNGNPVKGHFEFTANKRRGRIKCPFDFDREEEFEQGDETYVRKSFSMKGDKPEIRLSTASGTAALKK